MGARVFDGGVKVINGNIVMDNGALVDGVDVSALATTVGNFGTMAAQNANAVAITGGNINGTPIGASTPAAGTFTTLGVNTSLTISHANGIISSVASISLFDSVVTTLNFIGVATTLNMADDTTASGTYNLFTGPITAGNTKAINIGTNGNGGVINITLGTQNVGWTIINSSNTFIIGTLSAQGGIIESSAGTITLFSNVANATIALGALATTISIGGTTASNSINIATGITASGQTKTIAIGTNGASGSFTNISIGTGSGQTTISLGSIGSGTVTVNHDFVVTNNVEINGNLIVKGTLTYLDTETLRTVDPQIELNYIDGTSETNVSANDGGILLHGTTDKKWTWISATTSWTSNQNINLAIATHKYKVDNNDVIWWSGGKVATGTIGTGVWQGTAIALTYGGTNANLTAVNGGIVYSTATGMAITAAGTAGQILKSAGAATPVWGSLGLDDLSDVEIDAVNWATKPYLYWNGTKLVNASAATAGLALASALSGYLRLVGGSMTGNITFTGNTGIVGAADVDTDKLTFKSGVNVIYVDTTLSADGVVFEEEVTVGVKSYTFMYFIHDASYTNMRTGVFTMNHNTVNTPEYDENATPDLGTTYGVVSLRATMIAGSPNKAAINAIITSGTWTIRGYLFKQ